jgi:tRNA (cytidine/uridine-2'-O-)-methyltransferase
LRERRASAPGGGKAAASAAAVFRLHGAGDVALQAAEFDDSWGANCVKYEPRLHVVLHQPEIPYNTGSVGRTCVATGAKLWLVRPLGFRVDDYYLRRAGLDYWEQLEWEIVDDWTALSARLGTHAMYFFSKAGRRLYTQIQYQLADVLVFGCESKGLPPELLAAHADRTVFIPIRPQVRSLNLSNAVAIVLYEALRQWSARGQDS